MSTPNKHDADRLASALKDVVASMEREFGDRDPEGRSLSLGITMFFGMMLAMTRSLEDRQMMCETAMGYSFAADKVLAELEQQGEQ
jgi:hypothetical protein